MRTMQDWTAAEKAIWDAKEAVEKMVGSPALTDAVTLLSAARERVADHVQGMNDDRRLCPIGAMHEARAALNKIGSAVSLDQAHELAATALVETNRRASLACR